MTGGAAEDSTSIARSALAALVGHEAQVAAALSISVAELEAYRAVPDGMPHTHRLLLAGALQAWRSDTPSQVLASQILAAAQRDIAAEGAAFGETLRGLPADVVRERTRAFIARSIPVALLDEAQANIDRMTEVLVALAAESAS